MSIWKDRDKISIENFRKHGKPEGPELPVIFPVKKRHCNQCLYSERKLVSNERRREILRECREQDRFFNCHKATAKGEIACCHGFYKQNPIATSVMRRAAKEKLVRFVD